MNLAVLSFHSSPVEEPGVGDAGGMTVYVRRLAEALSAQGVATDVFTRATSDDRTPVVLSPGVRVVPISAGPSRPLPKEEIRSHLTEFALGIRAFSLAQRISYDLIHSHYWQSGLAATSLVDAWRVPLVHSAHTLGRVKNLFLAPGDSPEPEVRLLGEDRVIRAADVLVASTDGEVEQLTRLYRAPHDRVKTFHPGVDHSIFRPLDRAAARTRLGYGDEAVLLYVGRIQPLKGIDLAIQALEELVPVLERDVRLVVVGGASGSQGQREVTRLKRLASDLQIAEKVDFVGPHAHSALPTFYNAADVVTVCSHSESFGFAALEAHACGIPVVGTAVGGLSHVVRDGRSGFLVDSRDPSVFAARLKTLLSDQELQRSFSNEALRSSAKFSWDDVASAFLELYECLLRERSPEACVC
jgi:D-inositol-3-phosphate glycosyltransferase